MTVDPAWSFDFAFEVIDRDERYKVARPRRGVASREAERLALATIPAGFARYDRAHWRGPWPFPAGLDTWPNPAPDGTAPAWLVAVLGPVGVGKTMALTAFFRETVARWGYGGAWLDWSAVLDDVRRSFEGRATSGTEAALMSRRIVLLDDFGAERSTPWALEFASKILRRRHRENLPTLVSSNARNLGELSGAVDTRVLSRFAEGAVIVLSGKDRRIHGVAA